MEATGNLRLRWFYGILISFIALGSYFLAKEMFWIALLPVILGVVFLAIFAMAQVYAEMAKAAGIEINVNVTPAESYWDDVWLKKPLLTSAWYMANLAPSSERPTLTATIGLPFSAALSAARAKAGTSFSPSM